VCNCLKLFHLQVAHFEPETIHLHGEAIFPRIFLNLPRDTVTGEYEQLLCKARENLHKEANTTVDNNALPELDVANEVSFVLIFASFFCFCWVCFTPVNFFIGLCLHK